MGILLLTPDGTSARGMPADEHSKAEVYEDTGQQTRVSSYGMRWSVNSDFTIPWTAEALAACCHRVYPGRSGVWTLYVRLPVMTHCMLGDWDEQWILKREPARRTSTSRVS